MISIGRQTGFFEAMAMLPPSRSGAIARAAELHERDGCLLLSAVSNAGGLGTLGVSRIPAEQIPTSVTTIRATTTGPFGVNFSWRAAGPMRSSNAGSAERQQPADGLRPRLTE